MKHFDNSKYIDKFKNINIKKHALLSMFLARGKCGDYSRELVGRELQTKVCEIVKQSKSCTKAKDVKQKTCYAQHVFSWRKVRDLNSRASFPT